MVALPKHRLGQNPPLQNRYACNPMKRTNDLSLKEDHTYPPRKTSSQTLVFPNDVLVGQRGLLGWHAWRPRANIKERKAHVSEND